MAGLAGPSLRTQLALMGGLRWRIFLNSLRTKSARLDLLAYVLASVIGSLVAVGAGLGMGIGAYFLASRGRFTLLGLMLWAVFFVWQFMPLLTATSGSGFDFRNLLRFPLRFSAFYLLSLAFGLADPAALAALFWLICITAGVALARFGLFLPALILLFSYAAMNLLLSRMIFSWLERLLARRRTREALVAIFILCILLVQFSGVFAERFGRQAAPFVIKLLPLLNLLPPGLPGKALAGVTHGDFRPLLSSTTLLLGYAAVCGMLLRFRLRAQYLGEDLGETKAAAVPVTKTATARLATAAVHVGVSAPMTAEPPSFLSRLLPAPATAIVHKEIRYFLRNSVMLLNLALPIILIGFISLSLSSPRHATRNPFFTRMPDLAFPAGVAYMFLIFGQFAHNTFAYDGRGTQMYFLAPVRFRDVLLGKNLMLAITVALETVGVWILVSALGRPPRILYVLATLSWLLFALLAHFMVGNWLSLQFPRRFDFGQYRRRASGMSVLVGMSLQVVVLALGGLVGFVSIWSGRLWIFVAVFLGLSALAIWLYLLTLDHYSRFAATRREVLAQQLAR